MKGKHIKIGPMVAGIRVGGPNGDNAKADAARLKGIPEKTVCTKSVETYKYTQLLSSPTGGYGPIAIAKGVLNKDGKDTDIYMVALHGAWPIQLGEGIGMGIVMSSGMFNTKAAFYNDIVYLIQKHIPAGSNLIINGHSLGGMLAQQVAADETLKANYNILYTITFGSPWMCPGQQAGVLNRQTDKFDVPTYMSSTTWFHLKKTLAQRHGETTGMFSHAHTHVDSYKDEAVWAGYDALGEKGGSATLTIDNTTLTAYDAPNKLEKYETGYTKLYCALAVDGDLYGASLLF